MRRRIILSSVAVLVLAACGSSAASTTTTIAPAAETTAPAPETTAAATTVPAPETTAAAAMIQTASSSLGTILVDKAGLTVYLFTKDTPTTSACSGTCATQWHSVTGDATVGAGLDASKLTTITGASGEKQLAYNGHPLYYYVGDTKPGDTNGQKVFGVWFVIGTNGDAITT